MRNPSQPAVEFGHASRGAPFAPPSTSTLRSALETECHVGPVLGELAKCIDIYVASDSDAYLSLEKTFSEVERDV